jgi:hypothetical protein
VIRSPLLHFFLIGGLLYGAERASDDWRAFGFNRDVVRIGAAEQARVAHDLQLNLRRAPTAAERAAALNQFVDEEVLYREALRRGLDQSDGVVRSRLMQNMLFTATGKETSDGGALLREAKSLGMDRSDLVVRRRLVQLMERRMASGVNLSNDEVQSYLAAHADAYRPASRLRFTQVYLSADRHPHDLDAAAKALAAQLAREPARTDLGDPFLLGSNQGAATQAEIAARYGAAFADAVAKAPQGSWQGPIRSPYGLHFVRVEADTATPAANDSQTLSAARYALLEQRQHERLRERLAALRQHYVIQLDPPAVELGDAR